MIVQNGPQASFVGIISVIEVTAHLRGAKLGLFVCATYLERQRSAPLLQEVAHSACRLHCQPGRFRIYFYPLILRKFKKNEGLPFERLRV